MSPFAERLKQIHTCGLINADDSAFVLYDFGVLKEKIELVRRAFPVDWRHTVAIKTNPLLKVLNFCTSEGFGLEAASYEELHLGKAANAAFLIWDSPVKTTSEFNKIILGETPVFINANSLLEIKSYPENIAARHRIGLRINPEVTLSAHPGMSVGGMHSKFGEPISNRDAIVAFFKQSRQKIGLHVHASSQNLQTNETVEAIGVVYDLASRIGFEQIAYFDMGGGFPVSFSDGNKTPDLVKFSTDLQKRCPILFEGNIPVFTEFGRYYHTHAGQCISRIEEVKKYDNKQVIIHHLGANMFLRESYEPGKWPHKMQVLTKKFKIKDETQVLSDIGGPLCFGGDYLAKSTNLPRAEKGDYLLIEDTGANSIGLWSAHCSRVMPKVIGIDPAKNLFILKERQDLRDIVNLWS